MPELLLHIGTHKTGTTSIQRFCGANRDALREIGLWYPNASIGSFPDHYAHHRIAHAIAGRDDRFDFADARGFFKKVRRQAKADERCLISAEPMYRHVLVDPEQPGGQADAVEKRRRFERYVREVQRCVEGFDVTILVMLRRQDLFAESLFAEQIMATAYDRPIERFIVERRYLFDYEARLDVWAEVFGPDRISVRSFEPALFGSSVERYFADWLGLDWSDSFKVGKRHNVTPTRTFVEFKRMMNSLGHDGDANARYRAWITQLIGRVDPGMVPDLGRYYLQPRDRVELLESFDESNTAVAQRFGGASELFQEGPERELRSYVDRGQLTDQDFGTISQHLFRMLAEEA